MATTSEPLPATSPPQPSALSHNVGGRITGLDMARALAIIGMFMAHIGPRFRPDEVIPGDGILGAVYRSVNGRSAILFGVLAGIGVAILASRGRSLRATDGKLLWRALVLFVIGVWLQTLDMPVAIILHYYAVLFLIGAVANRLGDRGLLGVAASSLMIGPLSIVGMWSLAPDLTRAVPEWFRIDQNMFFILIAGYYPVVTWTAPFLFGMWLGRRGLRSNRTALRMAVVGVVATALAYGVSVFATGLAGETTESGDWRNLMMIEPHNQMPLWLISAAGVAITVIGTSLYLSRRFPGVTRPLVAVGQMAFTVYVAQIIVLTLFPQWVEARESYVDAWISVGRLTLVTILAVLLYRTLPLRGPFEWLIRVPSSPPWRHGDGATSGVPPK